jgi:hypothetical protein
MPRTPLANLKARHCVSISQKSVYLILDRSVLLRPTVLVQVYKRSLRQTKQTKVLKVYYFSCLFNINSPLLLITREQSP